MPLTAHRSASDETSEFLPPQVRARADQLLSGLPGLHAEARVLGVGYDRLRPADTVSSRPRLSLALPRTALARPPAHDSAAWTSRCGAAVATVLLSAISTAISVTFATENRFLRRYAPLTILLLLSFDSRPPAGECGVGCRA